MNLSTGSAAGAVGGPAARQRPSIRVDLLAAFARCVEIKIFSAFVPNHRVVLTISPRRPPMMIPASPTGRRRTIDDRMAEAVGIISRCVKPPFNEAERFEFASAASTDGPAYRAERAPPVRPGARTADEPHRGRPSVVRLGRPPRPARRSVGEAERSVSTMRGREAGGAEPADLGDASRSRTPSGR